MGRLVPVGVLDFNTSGRQEKEGVDWRQFYLIERVLFSLSEVSLQAFCLNVDGDHIYPFQTQ